MIFQILGAVLGVVISISIIVVAIVFIFSKVRENDMTILRSANKDLRDTADDNIKKIAALRSQVDVLIEKVDSLEKRNKTLEDLVVVALKQYFIENPKSAEALKDIMLPQAG